MEGGQPSAYCREQLGLFADGKISATEMRDRVVFNASGYSLWTATCSSRQRVLNLAPPGGPIPREGLLADAG